MSKGKTLKTKSPKTNGLNSQPEPALVMKELSFGYKVSSGTIPVLRRLGLEAQHDEYIGIVGPSGCGKSTLLRLLGGLIQPRESANFIGSVSIFGSHPVELRKRREVSYLFQEPSLLPWRDVLDNVLLPIDIAGKRRPEEVDKAREMLNRAGLGPFHDAAIWELSGGMQQRVALLRALIQAPKLLLLDEPFSALDDLTREDLFEILEGELRRKDVLVFLVSHDIMEAVTLCDRVIVLSDRPAAILGTVSIDLKHPRSFEYRSRSAILEASNKVGELLRAERQPRGRQ